MADKFWVGGSGTWDATTTTNWSLSSGGAGGAAVPGTSDRVIINNNSGSGSITITRSATTAIQGIVISRSNGATTIAGSSAWNINNTGGIDFRSSSGLIWSNTGTITFNNAAASCTLYFNGITIASPITINNNAITVTVASGGGGTTKLVTLTAGTLALASSAVFSVGSFTSATVSSTLALNFGSGSSINITATANGTVLTQTATPAITGTPTFNLNTAGFTATVNLTGANGAGSVAYDLICTGGGSVTFTANGGVGTLDIRSIASVTISGTSGNLTIFRDAYLFNTSGSYLGTGTPTFTFSGSPSNVNGGNGAVVVTYGIYVNPSSTMQVTSFLDCSKTVNVSNLASTLDVSVAGLRCNQLTGVGAIIGPSTASGTSDIFCSYTSPVFSWNGTVSGILTVGMSNGGAFNSSGASNIILKNISSGTITINGSGGSVTFNRLSLGSGSGITSVVAGLSVNLTAIDSSASPTALQSATPGTQFFIICASGTVRVYNVTIKDCAASGGAVFQAYTSDGNVDGGNNTGWYFAPPITVTGSFLPFFLGP